VENEKAKALDNPWEDLVIAILSVTQYKLEKTYALLDSLRIEGLFTPSNLMRWSENEIATRLRAGGCNRGAFMTKLFAERLAALGTFVKTTGEQTVEQIILSRDTSTVEKYLLAVRGIGPVVLENFYILRGIIK
jgi:hypothetical protein